MSSTANAERLSLTLKQRYDIIKRYERYGIDKKTRMATARDIVREYGLKCCSTFYRIIQAKDKIVAKYESLPVTKYRQTLKQVRPSRYPKVEEALIAWMKDIGAEDIREDIPYKQIKQKTEEIARNLGYPHFKCSYAYIQCIANRRLLVTNKDPIGCDSQVISNSDNLPSDQIKQKSKRIADNMDNQESIVADNHLRRSMRCKRLLSANKAQRPVGSDSVIISIDNVLDELMAENKRLLNELMFAKTKKQHSVTTNKTRKPVGSDSVMISIDDVLDELMVENKRLLNELLFANNCLNELKTHLINIHSKYETTIDCEDKQEFKKLTQSLDQINDKSVDISCKCGETSGHKVNQSLRQLSKEVANKELNKLSQSVDQMNDKSVENESILDFEMLMKYRKKKCQEYDPTTKTYRCGQCVGGQSFAIYRLYDEHVMRVHKQHRYVCQSPGCHQVFNKRIQLTQHKAVHPPDPKPYHCQHCPYRANRGWTLRSHTLRHHSNARPVTCDYPNCGKRLKDKITLRSHRKVIHKEGPTFQCPHPGCDQQFKIYTQLKQHRAIHLSTPSIECNKCPSKFLNLSLLVKHKMNKHGVANHELKTPAPNMSPEIYGCETSSDKLNQEVLNQELNKLSQNVDQMDDISVDNSCKSDLNIELNGETSGYKVDQRLRQFPKEVTNKELNKLSQSVDQMNDMSVENESILDVEMQMKYRKKKYQDYDPITNTYRCGQCVGGQWFANYRLYDEHVIRVHKQHRYVCQSPGCNQVYPKRIQLRQHMTVHPPDPKPFQCQHCPYRTNRGWVLKCHTIRHHSNARPVTCDYPNCGKRLKTKFTLRSHYKLIHNERSTFHCKHPGCGQQFKIYSQLVKHRAIHLSTPSIQCDQCPRKFLYPSQLAKHKMDQHYGANHQPKTPRPKKVPIMCEWPGCEFQCQKPYFLMVHKRVHTGERPFACEWPDCGKGFSLKYHLQEHMNVHKDLRPFVCHWPGCQYAARSHGNIRGHLRTHKK